MIGLTLSEMIVINRKRLGMTQAELAEAVGISRNYVSTMERGYMEQVSLKTLSAVLVQLGLEMHIVNKQEQSHES